MGSETPQSTVHSIDEYLESKSWEHVIPLNVSMELTNRCNERCIHCYIDFAKKGRELSFTEVTDTLDKLLELKTLQIGFTGGELFLRPDIRDILRYARKKAFNFTLSTNGTLIDADTADFLKHVKPWDVGISIYGSTPEKHEAITRLPGSYRRTVRAMELLLERNIRAKFKIVILKQNFDDYPNIKALADRLGAKVLLDFNITPCNNGDKSPLDMNISDEQVQQFMSNEEIGLDIYNMDQQEYRKQKRLKLNGIMCKAGVNFMNITAFGDVTPCVQWVKPVGNIREQSLVDIWRTAPLFVKLRHTFWRDIPTCRDCAYIAYCNRCPGVAEMVDGDAFGISSMSCRYINNLKAVFKSRLNKDLVEA